MIRKNMILNKLIKENKLEREQSKLLYSPDKKNIAIVNPYGWETMSNIYIYNIGSKKLNKIHEWKEKQACKDIKWLSNNELIVILGLTYGTINIGGDLYLINIDNKNKTKLKEFDDNIEIEKIREINNGKVFLTGIKYLDVEYNKSEEYFYEVKL